VIAPHSETPPYTVRIDPADKVFAACLAEHIDATDHRGDASHVRLAVNTTGGERRLSMSC